MKTFIYKVTINNTEQHLISLIESNTISEKGAESKHVIGHLKDVTKQSMPGNIVYNPVFVTLFQNVVKEAALGSLEISESAKDQVNGFIYIIDQRSQGKVKIKPHNIIAAVEVKDSEIFPDTFQFNPNYEIVSAEGLFQLPAMYEKKLIEALVDNL